MKLTINQENLAKSVSLASRFASTRAQLPILSNILFSADKSKLTIASTNLEISVSLQTATKVEETGEISIPSKVIAELVGNLPKENIEIETDKEQVKISTPGFSSKILGMNASDFPKVPNKVNRDKAIVLPTSQLSEGLSKVIFATSNDETRPILTGVLLVLEKTGLHLVATDGFRLSRKKISLKSAREARLVIPRGILNEISRVGEGFDEVLLETEEKEKQVVFGIEDVVLSSRLLEGDYPDFEKIIPKSSLIKINLDREEFSRSVKLASIFARESANIVKIKVLKDSVKVMAESGSSGSQETRVDAKVENNEGSETNWEISFNYRFLEEFLHSVKGEEVKMEFTTPDKAGVFKDTSDPDYLHLIMPVKVQ